MQNEWNAAWISASRLKTKSRYQKPLPLENRRDSEDKTYQMKSFKEKQAVKSLALQFLPNGSDQ